MKCSHERLELKGGVMERRHESGQGLLEFALILPVLLMILAGVLDLGRLYFAYVAVTDAAAEGASYAASYPNEVAEIEARAQGASQLSGVTVTYSGEAEAGETVTVTTSYSFTVATPIINGIAGGAIPLRATTSAVVLSGAQ